MDLGDRDLDIDPATLLLLRAARETGALEALVSDADTPAEVAASAGIDERAADLLVATLEREGFLRAVDGAPEPTSRLLGFLASADLRSIGALPAALDDLDALATLPATMASGDPPGGGSLGNRLGARAAADEAAVRAVTTAAVRAAPDADSVLDVRGAPGRHARAFARLGLDATLVDRPAAVERAAPLLASTAVETTAVGAEAPLPDSDLVFAGDVVNRLAPSAAGGFIERLATAATPAGTVVVADRVWEYAERAVPAAVTAFAREGGTVHREADLTAWFKAAGLGDPELRDVPGVDRQLVVGDSR